MRLGRLRRFARCCLYCILLPLNLTAADFYVSPMGNDANPGTKAHPFASLTRARDAIRTAQHHQSSKDHTVLIRGGTYALHETIVFSIEDSPAPGHTITYAAYPNEHPIFSSGLPIRNWVKEGKMWTATLPDSIKPFRTLYDTEGLMPRARGPAFSPTQDYKTADKLDRFTLPFPAGALRSGQNVSGLELVIRPNFGWILDVLPLESVDEQAGLARTQIPASYPMVKVRWGLPDINSKGSAWIENAVEDVDEPGEWALDIRARKLFVIPRTNLSHRFSVRREPGPPEGIEAPQLTELIRIEGEIDYDGPKDKPVRGLLFRGLSFTRGDRWPWEKNRLGWTLQHDWEMFDRPTALVRLRGAEHVRFQHCHWFDSGGAGLRMDLHAQSNRVTDSVFEHLGGAGILLAGYGPGTKDVNRGNEISRNEIHHIGQILWHAAAISVWQSGENQVAHNLIHDVTYTAITVSGRINWIREGGKGDGWRTIRWDEIEKAGGPLPTPGKYVAWKLRAPFLHGRNNLVEANEICGVMQKLWDGDAIYVSGTGGNNQIRGNFIHDCLSSNMCEGIRCDDDQEETVIERNVILRNGGIGTGIAIKGRNYIVNNFVVDPRGIFHPRGVISIESGPVEGSIIRHNVLMVSSNAPKPFYLKNLLGLPDPAFNETKTDYNLYWHSGDAHWADEHLAAARKDNQEQHSLIADPLFRNPEKGDFRFKRASPAPGLGIQPVDLRKAGLR
jgi:hypothetical protein